MAEGSPGWLKMRHEGGCHCGNLRFALETNLALPELPLRACQCSFCRRHGALSTSDPKGTLHLRVRDEEQLQRYRFGLNTADFLICAKCGIYIAAMFEDQGKSWAVINANTLDEVEQLKQQVTNFSYDGESAEARMKRRKERWTPLEGLSAFP